MEASDLSFKEGRKLDESLNKSARKSGVTLRAVLLGLASVVFMCWLANYQMNVTGSSILTLSNFPVCALIIFVIWVIINSMVRALAPGLALTPAELLTIMVMSWAAGMMPARGWSGRMVGILASVQHYASPENRWGELLGGLLPRWLFPELMGQAASSQAGNWFYTGVPEGQQISWSPWGVPLFWWSLSALATFGVAISITVIFHRQWVTYERLTFPLTSVPIELVQVTPGERVAPIFKKRAFWFGFLAVAGVLTWNLGGYLSHAWPKIPIYKSVWEIRQEIVTGFPYVAFRIMPLVIGFMYLCDLDILFSLWLFWFVGWLEAGFADTLGLSVGKVGKKLDGSALVSAHNYGAFIFLVIWSIWVARRHLKSVWQAALSRNRSEDNPGGVMSYRSAVVVLILSMAFLLFFALQMGMSLAVAVPALLLVVLAFFVVAKYMAATGLAYITPPSMANGELLESLIGSSWWSPQTVTGLGLLHGGAYGAAMRLFGFGMMPHALKVDEQATRGGRKIVLAIILALVTGASFSIWHTLRIGYTRAALTMDNYTLRQAPQTEFNAIAKRVEAVQNNQGLPPDIEKIGAWGIGFAGAAVLTFLRGRFSWWRLHPVGWAFSSSAVRSYWLSIFIVWFAKLIILKFGGVRLYEKAKPFFIGLVVGYVLSLILSYGVHEFFPGHSYQFVHDW